MGSLSPNGRSHGSPFFGVPVAQSLVVGQTVFESKVRGSLLDLVASDGHFLEIGRLLEQPTGESRFLGRSNLVLQTTLWWELVTTGSFWLHLKTNCGTQALAMTLYRYVSHLLLSNLVGLSHRWLWALQQLESRGRGNHPGTLVATNSW